MEPNPITGTFSNEGKLCLQCWEQDLCNRVQWFWHFFRNSMCFMCFLFGLEILRLFYKKRFLKYWTVSILFNLLSSEKSSASHYKSCEKISLKLGVQGIKRSGILRWFQKCAEVSSLAKGEKFYRKTEFLETWKIFSVKNLWELLDARVLPILKSAQNSASFDTLCAQFWRNFFFNSFKGRCCYFWR